MGQFPTDKPTEAFNWADGGGATRTPPGAPKRSLGWLFNEKPPFDFFNQIQGVFGDFIAWLNGIATRGFETVDQGIAATAPGEMFRVINALPKSPSDADVAMVLGIGDEAQHLCSDGLRLYVSDDPNDELVAYVANPEGATTLLWSEAKGVSVIRMKTDGAVVALGGFLGGLHQMRVFDAATGTILFTFDSVKDVLDVAPDTDLSTSAAPRVFYSDGASIREWRSSGGDALWSATIGGVLAMCTTPDRVVTIENDPAGGPNGLLVVSYDKITKSPVTIASFPAHPKNAPVAICSDGELAWVVLHWDIFPGTPQPAVVAMVPTSGSQTPYIAGDPFWAVTLLAAGIIAAQSFTRIDVDDRYVYALGVNELYLLDKATGAVVYREVGGLVISSCIDGTWMYKAQGGTPGTIAAMGTTRQVGMWLRAGNGLAADDNFLFGSRRKPFLKLAIPVR